jgi:hypothetical protein
LLFAVAVGIPLRAPIDPFLVEDESTLDTNALAAIARSEGRGLTLRATVESFSVSSSGSLLFLLVFVLSDSNSASSW